MNDVLHNLLRRRLVFGGALWPVLALGQTAYPPLSARHVYVGNFNETVLAVDADVPVQIASITKLVTAWVVLTAGLPMDERILITPDDLARSAYTASALAPGSAWSREALLEWLLVASDNRAAAALARAFPGGWPEFQYQMRALMTQMQLLSFDFGDSSGLSPVNQASARDLGVLLVTLAQLPWFQGLARKTAVGGKLNVNRFAHDRSVHMLAGKTGFTSAAGHCLALAESFDERVYALVVLNSAGREARAQDMNRLREYTRQHVARG